jgi:protein TonB
MMKRPSRGILFSAALHALFFVALFAAVPASRPLRITDAIQVNLVGAPGQAPAAKAAPAESPSVETPEKPQDRSTLEPEKTPNRPRDEAVKLPKKTAPAAPKSAVAEITTGAAAVGGAGLSAEVGVDEADFEFTYYLIALRNRIGQNWSAPAGMSASGQPVRAVVYFRIRRDGSIEGAKVEQSSGVGFFDQSALRAVLVANPVPPLPLGFGGSTLGVHFAFEYVGR